MTNDEKPGGWITTCVDCGSSNVECVDWVRPNERTVSTSEGFIEDWAYAKERGMTYCYDCEDQTELVVQRVDAKWITPDVRRFPDGKK